MSPKKDGRFTAAWFAGEGPSRHRHLGLEVPAMATIERYLVHVGWAYRMAELADPNADPLVKFECKAARNHLGVRQRQARGIRFKGDIADLDSPASGVCLRLLPPGVVRSTLSETGDVEAGNEGVPQQ